MAGARLGLRSSHDAHAADDRSFLVVDTGGMESKDSIDLHPELGRWLQATLGSAAVDAAAKNPLIALSLAVQRAHAHESGAALTLAGLAAWEEDLQRVQRDLRQSYVVYAAEAVRQGQAPEAIAKAIQVPPGWNLEEWIADLQGALDRTHPANRNCGPH